MRTRLWKLKLAVSINKSEHGTPGADEMSYSDQNIPSNRTWDASSMMVSRLEVILQLASYSSNRQLRLHRIAANLYASRSLRSICFPTCNGGVCKLVHPVQNQSANQLTLPLSCPLRKLGHLTQCSNHAISALHLNTSMPS